LPNRLAKKKGLQSRETVYEVTEENTLAACRRLNALGDGKVACLVFASAKNPCGGMIRGALAQEEAMGLCSGLYPCQTRPDVYRDYYEANTREPKDGIYQDALVYSPGVPVFREDKHFALLNGEDVHCVDMITAPAVNRSRMKTNAVQNARQVMQERMRHVLYVAAENQVDYLVLGAWGCGVFGNDPKEIAEDFKAALDEKVVQGRFSCVVFACSTFKPNREPFERLFNGQR